MIDLNKNANSHDTLEIIYYNGQCCVKKIFRKDIDRARGNVEKQITFKSLIEIGGKTSSVDILSSFEDSKNIQIIMPYIQGLNGAGFTLYGTLEIANQLNRSLSSLIAREIKNSAETLVSTSVFELKIIDVLSKTNDIELAEWVKRCLNYLRGMPKEMMYPIGECHGDLTLSNVILKNNGELILIDFLKTYLETPLQDIAKLKQELIYGWSIRYDENWLAIKGELIGKVIMPNLVRSIEKLYSLQSEIIMIVTLARIAPYVKDNVTKLWLIKSISKELGI